MHKVVFSLVFFLCLFIPLGANSLNFENIKELPNGDIRISFKLQKVALINAYALDDPSRIVIDVRDTKVSSFSEENNLGPLKLVRASDQNNLSRIVIDLNESVYWKKPWQIKSKDHVKLILEIKQSQKIKKNTRDILIAIDAGHGGKDPGSVGTNILEKDVTLMIAKELERTLRDTQGYKPIMIRSTDKFVNLDDRYQKARELGADLFVSIHADGFRLSRVKGASVYVWSEEASSITAENLSKAKLVADSSIKSKVGRLDFQDFDEDAARAIYQLAYEAKIENTIFDFEENLADLINQSDLCITRAGASTLAELSIMNKPFLTIPLVSAKDNHQFENANFYQNLGCCWIMNQKDFNDVNLEKFLNHIIMNKSEYNIKKNNLEKHNSQNSWNNINQKILEIINEN